MGKPRQQTTTQRKVINASEISQYLYCSYAWYLQRHGYKPKSALLDAGSQAHVALGHHLEVLERKRKHSRQSVVIGVLLLFAALVLMVLGVML